MATFRSVTRKMATLIIAPPTSLIITVRWIKLGLGSPTSLVRHIPYPPSFSRTPAKTMDPATGASTWALGSHRCPKYTGNFTKKASSRIAVITIPRLPLPNSITM